MPPVLYDTHELADQFEVTPETIRNWEKQGRIPSIRVGKKSYFNMGSVVRALRKPSSHQFEQETARTAV